MLTSQSCCRAGWLEWQWDLCPYSPQCCYCRYTWLGKSLHLRCMAGGLKTPDDLERKVEKRNIAWDRRKYDENRELCSSHRCMSTGGFRRVQWEQRDSGLQDEIVWQGIFVVTWSSSWTQGLRLFINPLCFINWIANEHAFPWMFWQAEKEMKYPTLDFNVKLYILENQWARN